MKEFTSHSSAWVALDLEEITINEVILIGGEKHKIVETGDKWEHTMIHLEEDA